MIIDSIIKGYSAFSLLPDEESGHRQLPQSESDHSDADSDDDLTDDESTKATPDPESPVPKSRGKRKPRKDAKASVTSVDIDQSKPVVDSVQTSYVDLDRPPVSISRQPSPSIPPSTEKVQAIPPPSPVKRFVFPPRQTALEEESEKRGSVDVAGFSLGRASGDLVR